MESASTRVPLKHDDHHNNNNNNNNNNRNMMMMMMMMMMMIENDDVKKNCPLGSLNVMRFLADMKNSTPKSSKTPGLSTHQCAVVCAEHGEGSGSLASYHLHVDAPSTDLSCIIP